MCFLLLFSLYGKIIASQLCLLFLLLLLVSFFSLFLLFIGVYVRVCCMCVLFRLLFHFHFVHFSLCVFLCVCARVYDYVRVLNVLASKCTQFFFLSLSLYLSTSVHVSIFHARISRFHSILYLLIRLIFGC